MERTCDGFVIAEEDMKIRGPGEIQGLRQSGISDLKIADLVRDMRLLELARDEAEKALQNAPDLAQTPSSTPTAAETRIITA
jgi:ATP-dependent DNA helicase RecG